MATEYRVRRRERSGIMNGRTNQAEDDESVREAFHPLAGISPTTPSDH